MNTKTKKFSQYRLISLLGVLALVLSLPIIVLFSQKQQQIQQRASTLTPSQWYNPSYLYKKQITIDHTKVNGGTDLINFPVLISLNDPALKTIANGGFVQNNKGYDIVFVASDNTTKLDHEIEKYVASTGQIVMWVRIPTLSATTDTVIYMYFDNTSVLTSQENVTGVWNPGGATTYRGVWHLGETSGNAEDSTSYGTNGTVTGSPQGASGIIGNAYSFNGSASQCVTITPPGDGHLDFGSNSFSYSAWLLINSAPATGSWYVWFYKGGSSATDKGYDMEVNSGPGIYGDISDGTNSVTSNSASIGTGTWTYLTVVVDRVANVLHFYKNGTEIGTAPSISSIGVLTSTKNLYFGNDSCTGGYPLNGKMDEVHISSVVFSSGWIATEYNNQNSPSTFFTVSPTMSNIPANSPSPIITATPTPVQQSINGLNVFVGYADSERPNAKMPVPWQGAPHTNYIGFTDNTLDSGAIRLENSSSQQINIKSVVVNFPNHVPKYSSLQLMYDLWGSFSIQPSNSTILAATAFTGSNPIPNFDSSEIQIPGATCSSPAGPSNNPPSITVTLSDGTTKTFTDNAHILDTGGRDFSRCGDTTADINESLPWSAIGKISLGPTENLTLAPAIQDAYTGNAANITATFLDASNSLPLSNATFTITVLSGPDAGKTQSLTTDTNGKAVFTYTGTHVGTDAVKATITNVSGGSFDSNTVTVNWIPRPTATQTPTPTLTSTPTPTPTPTPTVIPTPTFTPTPIPTDTPFPTATSIPTATPTPVPTNAPTPIPTSTPIPTATPVPGNTLLAFNLFAHGIGASGDNSNSSSGGNPNPLHPTRNITVSISDVNNTPIMTQQGSVTFDSTSGSFKGNVDAGNLLSTGRYLIRVKMDGFLTKLVPLIFPVTAGQVNNVPQVAIVNGDINNDNKTDLLDYNILVNCYGIKQNTSSCTMPPASQTPGADLDDDGTVDGIDYNLFLRELSVQNGD